MISLSLTLALYAGAVGCAPCFGRVAGPSSAVVPLSVAMGAAPQAVPVPAVVAALPVPAAAEPALPADAPEPVAAVAAPEPTLLPPAPAAPAPEAVHPQPAPADTPSPAAVPGVVAPAVPTTPVPPVAPVVSNPATPAVPAPVAPVPDAAPRAVSPRATPDGESRPVSAPVAADADSGVGPSTPEARSAPEPARGAPDAPRQDAPASRGAPAAAPTDPIFAVPAPGAGSAAATPSVLEPAAQAGDGGLRIYVMTMGPGDAVWEKFGHNAIWVHDPAAGTDLAYNYGMFDFRQENFVQRFIQGRMLYWMEGFDARLMLDHYGRQNRDVWVQELNLSAAQKREMRDFVVWNSRPENRFYRYDYYRDNCSTRVRDVIDRALGGRLRAETDTVATGTTYRWHTARLTASSLPEYSGLMSGLGPASDRPISGWEEMFLPMRLRDRLRAMRTTDEAGRVVPLVKWDSLVVPSGGREVERTEPPFRIPWYGLGGLVLGGVLVLLGRRAPRSGAARFGFAALASLWLILVSVAGLILAGLWGWTDHAIAYRNENLFQFTPLALPLVLLVPVLAYGARWAARPAVWLALAVAGLSVLGLVLQLLPGLDQVNGETVAMALPVHLGLAWAVLRLRDAAGARPAPARVAPAPGHRATRARRG